MKDASLQANTKKSNKKPVGKRSFSKRFTWALAIVVLLCVCLGLFFAKGGPAQIQRVYYGRVVRSAYHKEYSNLAPALQDLGLNENRHIKSTCQNEPIATDGVHAKKVLFCADQTDNYITVTSANKQNILRGAKQLDQLANKYGGRMYTNTGPTFIQYFSELTNGVDYNPDFGVTFVRDNYLCEVHVNVAYSNPNPPAYSIQFGCNAPRVMASNNYLMAPDNKQ